MLEDEIKVVDCYYDEIADAVIFRFDINPRDYRKIPVDGPDGSLIDAA